MGFNVNDKIKLSSAFDKSGAVKPGGTVTGSVVRVDILPEYGILVALDPAFVASSATGPEWVDEVSNTPYDWSFTPDGKYISDGVVELTLAE